jgi:hypothetical protein
MLVASRATFSIQVVFVFLLKPITIKSVNKIRIAAIDAFGFVRDLAVFIACGIP